MVDKYVHDIGQAHTTCMYLVGRVALQVEFVDGVTRLEFMRKSDEFKVRTYLRVCMHVHTYICPILL